MTITKLIRTQEKNMNSKSTIGMLDDRPKLDRTVREYENMKI